MGTPNMATLERSLQNFSLNNNNNHHHQTSELSPEKPPVNTTVELNSEGALPYPWEQCLDLETGQIYYINWKTGMRSEEDPRTTAVYDGDYYSEDDDASSYEEDDESEESSTESSPCCSREQWSGKKQGQGDCQYQDEKKSGNAESDNDGNSSVLVVAGCKGCFMYYMVPKQNGVCPKCSGQLIHFDRSENGSA